MNIPRIQNLIDAVKRVPDHRLHMDIVLSPAEIYIEDYDPTEYTPSCGSVCCAVGALVMEEPTNELQDTIAAELGMVLNRINVIEDVTNLEYVEVEFIPGYDPQVKRHEYFGVDVDGNDTEDREAHILDIILNFKDQYNLAILRYEDMTSEKQRETVIARLESFIVAGAAKTYELMQEGKL